MWRDQDDHYQISYCERNCLACLRRWVSLYLCGQDHALLLTLLALPRKTETAPGNFGERLFSSTHARAFFIVYLETVLFAVLFLSFVFISFKNDEFFLSKLVYLFFRAGLGAGSVWGVAEGLSKKQLSGKLRMNRLDSSFSSCLCFHPLCLHPPPPPSLSLSLHPELSFDLLKKYFSMLFSSWPA